MRKIEKYIALYAFAAMAMFFAAPYAMNSFSLSLFEDTTARLTAQVGLATHLQEEETQENSFTPVVIAPEIIEGRAAILYDVKNGIVLFEKNANAQLPLASITKLMTAYVARKNLGSDDIVTITEQALARDGDSSLLPDEQWRAHELSDFMLVTSSNDAAAALALAVGTKVAEPGESPHDAFVRVMNLTASDIGLTNTKFIDETGLDSSAGFATAYGSAKDVAILLGFLVRNEPALIEATAVSIHAYTSLSGVTHAARNTNEAIPQIPSLIAGKTGYTDLAGGNLAIVFDRGINNPIAAVVLGSSREGRFPDIEYLVSESLPKIK